MVHGIVSSRKPISVYMGCLILARHCTVVHIMCGKELTILQCCECMAQRVCIGGIAVHTGWKAILNCMSGLVVLTQL